MSETRILVVDVGGNNVKFLAAGDEKPRKFKSGASLTPMDMMVGLQAEVPPDTYTHVAIGVPAPVRHNRVSVEPVNLGTGWVDFDMEAAFGKPVRMVNDAVMQALGSYRGGTMLFLGLGTGLGAALVIDGVAAPLEIAHLPYKNKKTFEDFVGRRGLKRLGTSQWASAVLDVVERLGRALVADYVVLGGGNAKRLTDLPKHVIAGDNANAFLGGIRLWQSTSGTGATSDQTENDLTLGGQTADWR